MVITIECLPDELLELCLPRDATWAVSVGSLVCRRWKNLTIGSSICRLKYVMKPYQLSIVSKCPGCIVSIDAKKFPFWTGTLKFSNFLASLDAFQPTLRHLDLSYGSIDCFEFKGNYKMPPFPSGLISLKLDSLWFENISLESCTALQSLSLRRTKLTDATPLTLLVRLRKLDISFTPITNPSVLRCLTNLEELGMSFVRHSDSPEVEWISGLPMLTSLCLSSSGITVLRSNMRPLRLRALDLTFNQIKHCGFLRDIGSSLVFLGLGGNESLENLNDVGRYCRNLRELILYGTKIDDILPLANCLCLETLDLSCTPVRDIRPIVQLPHLSRLDLVSCCIDTLRPLSQIPSLIELNIETCKCAYDLTELAECRSLLRLSVCVFSREDLEPVLFIPDIRVNGCVNKTIVNYFFLYD